MGALFTKNSNDLNQKILKLHKDGYHISEIVDKLKCDEILVYNTVVKKDNKRYVSDSEIHIMENLRAQGNSLREISKEVGRSKECIRIRLKNRPKLHKIKEYTISDSALKKIKKWYLEGKTISWISRELDGLPRKSIQKRLVQMEIYQYQYSNNLPLTSKEIKKIISLRKKKYNVGSIAKEIGRPTCIVSKYLKEFY